MRPLFVRVLPFLLPLALAPWAPASAQDEPSDRFGDLESWLVLEEEDAPEAPLFDVSIGGVGFIEARTQVRASRSWAAGTRLTDMEEEQGLQEEFGAPWLEMTIGDLVRGGIDVGYWSRGGSMTRQEATLVFGGRTIAEPGDYVRPRFSYLNLGGFLEWNVIYGRTYRIGLVGGLRYFRLAAELRAARLGGVGRFETARARGELLSPFFGGLFELTPFPYLSVYSQIQFMSWSWKAIDLRSCRYFQFRLGAKLNVAPGRVSFGVEYRFLVVDAEARGGKTGLDAAISANGLGLSLIFSY